MKYRDPNEPPSGFDIQRAMTRLQSLRDTLLATDPELSEDEGFLTEILGQATDDVEDVIARLLRASQHAKMMEAGAKKIADDVNARATRYKRRKERTKETATAIMEIMGMTRLEKPDFTATVQPGGAAVRITDETRLPKQFIRTKSEPDKAAIAAELKEGVVIEGAELSNGNPFLNVRWV